MSAALLRLTLTSALMSVAGCAALITGSGTAEDQIIHAGMTKFELVQSLGPPLSTKALAPARRAWDLREIDPQISLLIHPGDGFDAKQGNLVIPPADMAVSESSFRFRGRVGKDNRAAQPGFDSFMTLGLAEIYLIPKALWERAREDDALLTVWFDSSGRALAYKWAVLTKQPTW
jgi:hypothetical protein